MDELVSIVFFKENNYSTVMQHGTDGDKQRAQMIKMHENNKRRRVMI